MQKTQVIHQLRYALIILSLLYGGGVLAQGRAATFVPVAPKILSNSFVRCFFKDSRGYMWLGTAEGLMRYDGTYVVRYEHNPDDNTTIPHNLINVITEDSDKTLWIGTAKGLIKFNRELENFTNVDSISGSVNHLNNRFITALAFDQTGHLWIGTHGDGINVYNPITLTFQYISKKTDQYDVKSPQFINSILCVDDLIWCATKQGLELYNAADKKRASLKYIGSHAPIGEISQVARDNAGNIWLASATGDITKLTEGNGYYTCKTVVSGQAKYGASWVGIRVLTRDAKDNFWIAGENSGLNYLDTRTGEITRFLTENERWGNLPTNSVLTVFVDDAGLTWIGTPNQGAYLLDENSGKFNLYNASSQMTGKVIRGIAEDPKGKIWLAFEGMGLATLEVNTGEFRFQNELNATFANKFLTSLICDREGNLWVGTTGGGVYKVDSKNGRYLNCPDKMS